MDLVEKTVPHLQLPDFKRALKRYTEKQTCVMKTHGWHLTKNQHVMPEVAKVLVKKLRACLNLDNY